MNWKTIEVEFLEEGESKRGKWLVCTATITERKRVLELAQAAVVAKTPVWVLGKPYADDDPYAMRFLKLAPTLFVAYSLRGLKVSR